ncbi:MAG: mechanosensitive ion channel [Prevotella sp.]|nr:mechanosensitive ion channel [Prevotella sp.]
MEKITFYVERLLTAMSVPDSAIPVICHIVLVIVAVVLALLSGWVCKRVFIPLINKVTRRTEARWDDVLLSSKVLNSAFNIVPAIVIWQLLPLVFYEYPTVREMLARLTAIYITVMTVRTSIVFIDSFKELEGDTRTAKQQYLYTVCSVLKILMLFIAAIIVVSIAFDKNPTTLFAGLGAASAILMLAFQDTIKGLVAGIRLTSNDMLRKGDRITVPGAGADGIVEDVTLTTVKVRNFDNTIITVTPQTLVDGSFQNWKGMKENVGRKAARKVYFDFSSIKTMDDREDHPVNLTLYRQHMEDWLAKHEQVLNDKAIMVHQLDGTPTGLPVEFVFWLRDQDALPYEHAISEIMEHAYAVANDYGLRMYQR